MSVNGCLEAIAKGLMIGVRTPWDMIMAGPRWEAGNSQPRRVSPSRVMNSTSERGRALAVITFLCERVKLETDNEEEDDCGQGTGPVLFHKTEHIIQVLTIRHRSIR